MITRLIHTCTIQRRSLSTDAYGNKSVAWADHQAGQACRLVEQIQQGLSGIAPEMIVASSYSLYLPFVADIKTGDRVTRVDLEDGDQDTHTYEVRSVIKRRGASRRYKVAALQKVV